jgi:hypothetical protein
VTDAAPAPRFRSYSTQAEPDRAIAVRIGECLFPHNFPAVSANFSHYRMMIPSPVDL